jgi:ferrous iron transport protein B
MGSIAAMRAVFLENGWTPLTALCTAIFFLFHWPCSTTLLTVKKETGSWGYTALAAALPTVIGMLLCMLVAAVGRIFL